jgi:hypothetical protein
MAADPSEKKETKVKSLRAPAKAAARDDGETPMERVNRDLAILNLRLHGLTFHEIARKLPEAGFRRVSVSRIFAIVTKNLRSCRDQPARELRQLELLRLDQLQAAHYKAAVGGDAAAITRVLSIMDRRAKLLGLDAGPEAVVSLDQARQTLLKKLDALARGQAASDESAQK